MLETSSSRRSRASTLRRRASGSATSSTSCASESRSFRFEATRSARRPGSNTFAVIERTSGGRFLSGSSSSTRARTARISASFSTPHGDSGSGGIGATCAQSAGSFSTNASMRALASPCTSTLTRPSGRRRMRITIATVPTGCRSSASGSSTSGLRCAASSSRRSPESASSTAATERSRVRNSGSTMYGNTTNSRSGRTGSSSGSWKSGGASGIEARFVAAARGLEGGAKRRDRSPRSDRGVRVTERRRRASQAPFQGGPEELQEKEPRYDPEQWDGHRVGPREQGEPRAPSGPEGDVEGCREEARGQSVEARGSEVDRGEEGYWIDRVLDAEARREHEKGGKCQCSELQLGPARPPTLQETEPHEDGEQEVAARPVVGLRRPGCIGAQTRQVDRKVEQCEQAPVLGISAIGEHALRHCPRRRHDVEKGNEAEKQSDHEPARVSGPSLLEKEQRHAEDGQELDIKARRQSQPGAERSALRLEQKRQQAEHRAQ